MKAIWLKYLPPLAPAGHSTQEGDLTGAKTQGHDEGYLLVVLALPFALLFFRKGLLAAGALFLMPHLQAVSTDFWQTRDQLAEQLFKQGEYKQAKELFQNPDWKAAASYQLGEYEEAAKEWESKTSPDGLYNYGTAKAKIGDFDAALESFDKALEIEPDHEDALYNKKLIEEWKKQQQPQEQKKPKPQQEQKQNQQQPQEQQNQQEQKGSQNKGESDSASQKAKRNERDLEDGDRGEEERKESSSSEDSGDREETKEKDEKKGEELKEQYQAEMDQKIAENEKKEGRREEFSGQELNSPQDSQLQADERWLQRVKDDPGGLLRRKFLLKYQQQNRRRP